MAGGVEREREMKKKSTRIMDNSGFGPFGYWAFITMRRMHMHTYLMRIRGNTSRGGWGSRPGGV